MSFYTGNRPHKQAIWRLAFFAVLLGLAAVACSSAGTPTPASISPTQPESVSTLVPPAANQTSASGKVEDSQPAATESAPDLQTDEVFQGPQSVVITSIADNSVVTSDTLELQGQADPGTVISIKDQIAVAAKDRSFHMALKLDQGLNVLEITASDPQGNQATAYLTITYQP